MIVFIVVCTMDLCLILFTKITRNDGDDLENSAPAAAEPRSVSRNEESNRRNHSTSRETGNNDIIISTQKLDDNEDTVL